MTEQQVTVWTPDVSVPGVEREFRELAKVHNSVTWEAEQNYAIQQLMRNKFTCDVATKNPVSVQNAVRNVAAIGLTLNPALKYAYLVPRDGMICLDVSYMGLMHLAQDTGSIMWAQCKIVHENDDYENRGASVEPMHKYNAFGDRGAIVGAYCVAKTADGDFLTHEMAIADIYAIRDRSQAWKSFQAKKSSSPGPWGTDEKEMIKKTVVKQASKYFPKVERLSKAIDVINTESGEGIDFEAEQRSYTDEQRDKFMHYLEHGSPIEFRGYARALQEQDEWIIADICSTFEKGDKVAGKKRVSEKEREGIMEIRRRAALAIDEDEEIRETAFDGLNELEVRVIKKHMKEGG